MCGICGIVNFTSSPVEADLWRMTRSLAHRGPDDAGVYLSEYVGLGQTRLSIMDLSPMGHQPMVSDDGSVVLVYNGELYNAPHFRRVLEQQGIVFRGHSDTEVLLRAYLHLGVNLFSQLNGMFAFAIWDKNKNQLLLGRDRFGIKPLYYSLLPNGIVFGSEIKSLLASHQVSASMNDAALHEYMWYGNSMGEQTIFEGIKRLSPGTILRFSKDQTISVSRYWSCADVTPVHDDVETAISKVRYQLKEAVQAHLQSDVPVGIFLSGGLDSSAITAFASQCVDAPLQTFSVGFDSSGVANELPKARQIAELFHTDHHELHVAGGDAPDVIEALVRCHDEPFADAANIPLYLLCQQVKGAVKVVLQGDGGDEIFGGYRRYQMLSQHKRWSLLSKLGLILGGLMPKDIRYYRLQRYFRAVTEKDPALMMALLLTQEDRRYAPTRILSERYQARVSDSNPFQRYEEVYESLKHLEPVQRMLYTDCSIQLPDTFLEKVDKATMANSLEIRVPLLDLNLTNYVMGLPASYKVRRGQKKWLLRQVIKDLIPETILNQPKLGFNVPVSDWLRTSLADYMRDVLLDDQIQRAGLFDQQALSQVIQEHLEGRRNHGFLLWKALNLALWYNFYL